MVPCETVPCCQNLEAAVVTLIAEVKLLPSSRESSVAITHLDTARLWLKEYQATKCEKKND